MPTAEVVSPEGAGYDKARAQWASKMSTTAISDERLHPELIVFCNSDKDVSQAVQFAKQCGYKVPVRSGGHQYAGLSACVKGDKCLQLDVSRL